MITSSAKCHNVAGGGASGGAPVAPNPQPPAKKLKKIHPQCSRWGAMLQRCRAGAEFNR